ncbi:hypothetical protein PHISP_00709 [Aspergillus sp. HF37]|nr:hypothetical protein PHISP_00709 [Aspergillus sp. HF37]
MAASVASTTLAEPSRAPSGSAEIVPDDDPNSADDPAFLTETDAASSTQSLSSSMRTADVIMLTEKANTFW